MGGSDRHARPVARREVQRVGPRVCRSYTHAKHPRSRRCISGAMPCGGLSLEYHCHDNPTMERPGTA